MHDFRDQRVLIQPARPGPFDVRDVIAETGDDFPFVESGKSALIFARTA
jgi:hypothetical protein